MFDAAPTIRIALAAAAAALLTFGTAVRAAVPVEESVAAGDRAGASASPAARDGSAPGGGNVESQRLAELFYELQVLRQEVQELRGMMEEQGHRLDRLAQDQQEQYLDLDRRMQALRGGDASLPSRGPQDGGRQEDDGSPGARASSGADGAPASEREAYAAAFDLMRERQFEASIDAFSQLVDAYPNGAYTPNAFYWLGELYLAQEQDEKARQSFAQVVNLYPDHQKVADALYKLGVVYDRLGDVERAREYLNRVRNDYPQSSAAGLAQTYLAEL